MIRIDGTYHQTWTNAAAGNLVRQAPLIAGTFPGIGDFYPATVNVLLDRQVIVAGCDHRTPPLKWKAAGEDGEAGEVFDLLRVRLTIGPHAPLAGLMYVGHWSVHRLDAHKHEFLVERFVEGLTHGLPVTVEIDRPTVDLPYSKVRQTADGPRAARTIVVL